MAHISDETFKLEAVRDNMVATTSTQGARDIREKSKVEKLLPQWEGLWQEIGDKVRSDSTGTMLQHAIPLLKQVLGKLNTVQAKRQQTTDELVPKANSSPFSLVRHKPLVEQRLNKRIRNTKGSQNINFWHDPRKGKKRVQWMHSKGGQ